jgi:hypothetical protein
VKAAVKRMWAELAREFPPDRYDTDATESTLESQLPARLRQGSPLLLAFVERAPIDESLSSWTVHVVDVAGVGAKLDSMVTAIRPAEGGTWKTREQWEQPLVVPPFGCARHTWQFLWGAWQGSSVRITFSGYSQGKRGELLMVRCPEQYPG